MLEGDVGIGFGDLDSEGHDEARQGIGTIAARSCDMPTGACASECLRAAMGEEECDNAPAEGLDTSSVQVVESVVFAG